MPTQATCRRHRLRRHHLLARSRQHRRARLSRLRHQDARSRRWSDAIPRLRRSPRSCRCPSAASAARPSARRNGSSWHRPYHRIAARAPELVGFVIPHGTATLEETAYFLHLTLKTDKTVVAVGAQRPASALSSDAGMNLLGAVRAASAPQARGLGVLVVLNDEVHCAREATKTSTYRLQTFRTPDFGALGHVDGDGVQIYRRPVRPHAPDTEFEVGKLGRVCLASTSATSYGGADGTVVEALVAAGARGIVSAGLAPGIPDATRASSPREGARCRRRHRAVEPGRQRPGRPAPLPRQRPAWSQPTISIRRKLASC